ncbi:MAG TPA: Flp pilus assembly protein CpaB [Gemmataceae bacterium]|nr:Flp pilus assembly protein CpaB [Gemmataceae bacterium]
MKPKAYIFAGLAIVCGLGASYMTSRLLAERVPDEPERVNILVAKRQINVGERVNKPEDMFEVKPVLKENEPPDAVKDFDALKGKTMRQSRNKGDHVTPANLYDKDQIEIPEGHQAVGLPVNLATTAHGLATLPGSRVNLILTARGNDAQHSTARVLLHNVLVLAADGRTQREGDPIAPAQVVTFALTEKDALRVSLAQTLGQLSLSLRKLNDTGATDEELVVTGLDIFNNKKLKDEPKQAPTLPPVVAVKEPTPEPKKEVEVPKDIRSVVILNGRELTRHQVEVLPNGETREVDGQADAPPVPAPVVRPRQQPQPRVQPQPPQQQPPQQPQPQGGSNGGNVLGV